MEENKAFSRQGRAKKTVNTKDAKKNRATTITNNTKTAKRKILNARRRAATNKGNPALAEANTQAQQSNDPMQTSTLEQAAVAAEEQEREAEEQREAEAVQTRQEANKRRQTQEAVQQDWQTIITEILKAKIDVESAVEQFEKLDDGLKPVIAQKIRNIASFSGYLVREQIERIIAIIKLSHDTLNAEQTLRLANSTSSLPIVQQKAAAIKQIIQLGTEIDINQIFDAVLNSKSPTEAWAELGLGQPPAPPTRNPSLDEVFKSWYQYSAELPGFVVRDSNNLNTFLVKVRSEIDRIQKEKNHTDGRLKQKLEQILLLQQELDKSKSENDRTSRDLTAALGFKSQQAEQIKERDKQIASIKSELDNLQTKNAALDESLETKSAQISGLQKEKDKYEQQFNEHVESMTALSQEKAKLIEQEQQTRRIQKIELEKSQAEIEELKRQNQTLQIQYDKAVQFLQSIIDQAKKQLLEILTENFQVEYITDDSGAGQFFTYTQDWTKIGETGIQFRGAYSEETGTVLVNDDLEFAFLNEDKRTYSVFNNDSFESRDELQIADIQKPARDPSYSMLLHDVDGEQKQFTSRVIPEENDGTYFEGFCCPYPLDENRFLVYPRFLNFYVNRNPMNPQNMTLTNKDGQNLFYQHFGEFYDSELLTQSLQLTKQTTSAEQNKDKNPESGEMEIAGEDNGSVNFDDTTHSSDEEVAMTGGWITADDLWD